MVLWKVAKYTAIALGLLVVASIVASVLWTLLMLLWGVLKVGALLLAVAAITYVIVKGALWLGSGGDSENPEFASNDADPLDQLRDQYVNGDLSESEFERRLEHELDDGSFDEIDRELERA